MLSKQHSSASPLKELPQAQKDDSGSVQKFESNLKYKAIITSSRLLYFTVVLNLPQSDTLLVIFLLLVIMLKGFFVEVCNVCLNFAAEHLTIASSSQTVIPPYCIKNDDVIEDVIPL